MSLLVLGIALPASLVRPTFLRDPRLRTETRARWSYCYTMFAFAILGFVDVAALRLLRPRGALSTASRGALVGSALIFVVIVAAVHVPPIALGARSRLRRWGLPACAVLLGLGFGGFFGVDLVYPTHGMPLVAVLSWAALLALATTATVWFSGFSPETRIALYARRRRRRRSRRLRT